ncbi:MAG: glycosyltransferase family 2 protein [Smithella sp.]|jgi:glycosyltransferase involved in cell wall biosynthesis
MMKITLITVCLNSAATIRDTLESVSSQSYKNIEHIVVDGGSVDKTPVIVREWKKHPVRFISEPDKGKYDAMNKGIRLAVGDVIGILNSDDIYYDSHVLETVARTMNDSAVDACYADLIYVDKNNPEKIIRYWKSCSFKKGLFARGWMPAHPTFFARRLVYEKYGLFDLNYSFAADVELLARFMERFEIKSVYIPKIFTRMRSGGDSNKSLFNIIMQNIEIYRACKKNNLRISSGAFIFAKIAARIRQYSARPTA